MNMNEELKNTLMDKLSREQDKYRDWLKGQPPGKSSITAMNTPCGRIF